MKILVKMSLLILKTKSYSQRITLMTLILSNLNLRTYNAMACSTFNAYKALINLYLKEQTL